MWQEIASRRSFKEKATLFEACFGVFLPTGGHIRVCKRGAGCFPAQGQWLCAIYAEEEGKPTREPSWPGKGGEGGKPGAHHQKGGDRQTYAKGRKAFWQSGVYTSIKTLPSPTLHSSTTLPSSMRMSSTSITTSSTLKTSRRRYPSRARRTSTWPRRSTRGRCSPCQPTGRFHRPFYYSPSPQVTRECSRSSMWPPAAEHAEVIKCGACLCKGLVALLFFFEPKRNAPSGGVKNYRLKHPVCNQISVEMSRAAHCRCSPRELLHHSHRRVLQPFTLKLHVV